MKYAIVMSSGPMIYIPSLINTSSPIQNTKDANTIIAYSNQTMKIID
jgi:hypothetical protein